MSWEAVAPALPTEDQGRSGWSPLRHAVRVEGGEVNSKGGTRAWQVSLLLAGPAYVLALSAFISMGTPTTLHI